MNSIHIASVISNLRNSLVWGWGLGGEGVVRVVLEAPPLVVALVKVQPCLPPALNCYCWRIFYFYFFCYSVSSIGMGGTFVFFLLTLFSHLVRLFSACSLTLLCVPRGVASQLVSHTLFTDFVEIHSKPYFATPTAGHNSQSYLCFVATTYGYYGYVEVPSLDTSKSAKSCPPPPPPQKKKKKLKETTKISD